MVLYVKYSTTVITVKREEGGGLFIAVIDDRSTGEIYKK